MRGLNKVTINKNIQIIIFANKQAALLFISTTDSYLPRRHTNAQVPGSTEAAQHGRRSRQAPNSGSVSCGKNPPLQLGRKVS
jgi:hypothetical protein